MQTGASPGLKMAIILTLVFMLDGRQSAQFESLAIMTAAPVRVFGGRLHIVDGLDLTANGQGLVRTDRRPPRLGQMVQRGRVTPQVRLAAT